MSELCVTLLCPPPIEEKLLDLLLMSSATALFTSAPAAAHGLAHEELSQMEQVLGRAQAVQVQVIVPSTDKTRLFETLREQFSNTGLRYWVTPVLEAGEFA
jgi:hypothetical protein